MFHIELLPSLSSRQTSLTLEPHLSFMQIKASKVIQGNDHLQIVLSMNDFTYAISLQSTSLRSPYSSQFLSIFCFDIILCICGHKESQHGFLCHDTVR